MIWQESKLYTSISVFCNLGSAESRGSANSFPASLKMLKIVLYGTFRFRQVIRNFQGVSRIEKGWKTLFYIMILTEEKITSEISDLRKVSLICVFLVTFSNFVENWCWIGWSSSMPSRWRIPFPVPRWDRFRFPDPELNY